MRLAFDTDLLRRKKMLVQSIRMSWLITKRNTPKPRTHLTRVSERRSSRSHRAIGPRCAMIVAQQKGFLVVLQLGDTHVCRRTKYVNTMGTSKRSVARKVYQLENTGTTKATEKSGVRSSALGRITVDESNVDLVPSSGAFCIAEWIIMNRTNRIIRYVSASTKAIVCNPQPANRFCFGLFCLLAGLRVS